MISSPVTSSFVGRALEKAFLLERFEAVRKGRLNVVLIEGDAGIGKTRLIDEFVASLPDHAASAAVGCCLEYVRAPYLPFNELFAELGLSLPSVPAAGEQNTGTEDKLAHFLAIAVMLQKRARRLPLVMIVEDVQWADDATLELVQHLCHELQGERVMLILSCRSDAVRRASSSGSFFARLSRMGADHMRLAPLRPDEVRSLIRATLIDRADLSTDLLRRVELVSDGNPLFIEEMLRTAIGHAPGTEAPLGEIPLTIKAMLWERILPLSNRDRDILTHAAVIGRSFDASFLARITGRSYRQVLDVLQRARDLQLVIDQPGNPPTYAFRHALLRETLYRELLPDVCGPLHARIAATLEELPDCDDRIAERAYHWTIARIEDKAIECNERAGDAAVAVYAYSDAIQFYRQALQFGYPSGIRRARLYERFARLLYLDGRESEPSEWIEKALEEYQRLGDSEGMARVVLDTANQRWLEGQTQRSMETAATVVHMLALDEPGSELLTLARLTLARYCVTLGRGDEALHQLEDVDGEALGKGDDLRAPFNEIRSEAHAALGDPRATIGAIEEALRSAEASGDPQIYARTVNACAMTATDIGEMTLAKTQFDRVLAMTKERGLAWREAYAAANYAFMLMLTGELDQARSHLVTAMSVPMNGPLRMRVAIAGIPLGLMLCDEKLVRQSADERLIESAFRSGEMQRIGGACAAFASLYAARGDEARAVALLRRALAEMTHLHRSWPFAIEVARMCGPEEVDMLRSLLLRYGETHRVAQAHRRLVELLYSMRFERVSSQEHVAQATAAAALFNRLGWPPHEAFCLELAGDHVGALAIYDRIHDLRGGSALRARMGLLPADPEPSKSIPLLTKRQTEVATLVARGVSNREIASALSISENTVEHHISEIFSRLGIASRAQLIARLAKGEAQPLFARR